MASGGGRLLVGLAVLPVLALLALFGLKLAANAGWFQGNAAVSGGAPGIFTSGRLVEPAFRRAPDFTLQLFSGGQLDFGELRGNPVMVNFWASWCPPCRQEAPLLERMGQEYQGKGLIVVGVNIWDNDADARRFLKDFGITFATGPDPRGQISIDYGLTGIPETFFVDRRGQVTRKWLGPFTEETLRQFLDEITAPGD